MAPGQPPRSKEDLRAAASQARRARNSLRRLVAALSGGSDGHGSLSLFPESSPDSCASDTVTVQAIRTQARLDLAELETRAAAAEVPLRKRARGLPPRPAANTGFARDLTPRLRLRSSGGGAGRILAAALSPVPTQAQGASQNGSNGSGGEDVAPRVAARIAMVRSDGAVEVWVQDPFSWHHVATAPVPAPACASASVAFSEGGALLWVAVANASTSSSSPTSDPPVPAGTARLLVYAMVHGTLQLVGFSTSPLAGIPVGSPASAQVELESRSAAGALLVLSQPERLCVFSAPDVETLVGAAGAVVSVEESDVAQVEAEVLPQVCVLEPQWRGCSSRQEELRAQPVYVAEAWPLPPRQNPRADDANAVPASFWRFAIWANSKGRGIEAQGGELQVLSGVGECLSVLSLSQSASCLAVPAQGACPDEVFQLLKDRFGAQQRDLDPVLVLFVDEVRAGAPELTVALASGDNPPGRHAAGGAAAPDCQDLQPEDVANLRLLTLGRAPVPWPAGPAEVVACSASHTSFRTAKSSYIFDWQQLRTQPLPPGWLPIALGSQVVVLLGSDHATSSELLFLEPC